MLADFLKDYFSIIIFIIIALGLSFLFIIINFALSPKKPDPEKLLSHSMTQGWNLMLDFT